MAHRATTKDRIGVGAAQNRPQNHRFTHDVGGDAGQPAHQRTETPRCATRRDASIRTPMIPRLAPIPAPTIRDALGALRATYFAMML
jgi:hypothetical protein